VDGSQIHRFIAFVATLGAAVWAPVGFAATVNGDFNGDGYADLAIGAPREWLGFVEEAGVVIVIYGGPDGLAATGSQRWHQNKRGIQDTAETEDNFGGSLAAADFDGDGFSDLAVGIPGERPERRGQERRRSGAVAVLYGSSGGLTTRDQLWTQASPGIPDAPAYLDNFGQSLAAANLGKGRRADLAIGVPGEDLGVESGSGDGAVHVLYGASGGLSATGNQFWHQDSPGIVDTAEGRELLGSSLAAANFGKSRHADLAIGVVNEVVGGAPGAGAVSVLYGGSSGLSAAGDQLWHQNRSGIEDQAEFQDFFGDSVSAANFGKSAYRDLAIGVPNEDLGSFTTATSEGVVHVLYGTATGLSSSGSQLWNQDVDGIEDTAEVSDGFGRALAAENFGNGSYADLAIGVPAESVGGPAVTVAGAVNVLYGSADGLTVTGAQFWYQGAAGLPDSAEQRDFFGSGLGAANFGKSGQADLAVGVPVDDVDTIANAGAVDVIYGTPSGLSGVESQHWHQDVIGIPDKAEEDDLFGLSLAARR